MSVNSFDNYILLPSKISNYQLSGLAEHLTNRHSYDEAYKAEIP
jgi:hypothetical protein